jgi:hypothetical protein
LSIVSLTAFLSRGISFRYFTLTRNWIVNWGPRLNYNRNYEFTLGEAYVQTPRKTREGTFVSDGVHMPSSLHYTRLAIDLNLFIRGVYITRSDDMAWIDLGSFWKGLDPSCSWGGDFGDANHFSVTFGGRR